MLNKKPNKQNQNKNDKLKKQSEAQNTNKKGLFQRNIKNSWEWHQKDGRPGGPSLPTPPRFNKYLKMKIVLEELWSTIKKLQQPSRAQKNKDVWIEKYRKHFTCVIQSSRFIQLGTKRNALSNNSPQIGEKESRKTPAAFTTKDLNSPHHYHGHQQLSPPRTLTVFANVYTYLSWWSCLEPRPLCPFLEPEASLLPNQARAARPSTTPGTTTYATQPASSHPPVGQGLYPPELVQKLWKRSLLLQCTNTNKRLQGT